MFFKTVDELKAHVEGLYDRVKPLAVANGIYSELSVFFAEGTPNNQEGVYSYSSKRGYHYCFTERGEIVLHNITQSLFEISYWIIKPEISKMATEFERKHREEKRDSRRVYFQKTIELFNCLGDNYRKRIEIEIDEILKTAPYQDDLC